MAATKSRKAVVIWKICKCGEMYAVNGNPKKQMCNNCFRDKGVSK